MTVLDTQQETVAPAATAPPATKGRRPFRPTLGRFTGVVVALLIVCIYLTVTQSVFLTWGNITNIVSSNSVVLILAIGATFVIISGAIDLSAASMAAAAGMSLGLALRAGLPPVVAIVIPIVFGLVVGAINGMLISWAKISFLVVTLGAMSILASFALVSDSGHTISVFGDKGFSPIYSFVNKDIGSIPILMIFDVLLVLLAGFVLRYTSFGRSLFAVGSNSEAARLNGINVGGIVVMIYMIAGLSGGLASIVQVGRLTGAAPSVDPTQLMTVIAAVLIGGTAFSGGEGGVLGTLIGVLFLGVIQNGLTLSEVSSFWQGSVNGTILILAVGLGVLRERGIRMRRKRMVTTPVG
jgi:ribose transport system permease protein